MITRTYQRPALHARKQLAHLLLLLWREDLRVVVSVADCFQPFTSSDGRSQLFAINKGISTRLNILYSDDFPVVKYSNESPVISTKRLLRECMKDALYILHTGKFPGPDRQRRNRRLLRWGYFA